MADKKEYVSFTTPFSPARYCKFHKQDVYDGKEVGYKGEQLLEGKELAQVKKIIDEAIKKLAPGGKLKAGKSSPLREDKDGNVYITAKTYELPVLFAAKGKQKLPEGTIVGGGSTIRMKLSMTMGNGHLVAYLNGVQVAKLVKGTDGDGFDDADEYLDEDADQAEDEFDDADEDDMGI